MIVTVKKDIVYDKNIPFLCVEGDSGFSQNVCPYYVERDRNHGKKGIERHCPKCALFDVWLDGKYVRCEECKKAIKESEEEHEQRD